jgi:hypothetical protein
MGHDTFQYLQLEYTFFNEAALKGGLPLWIPHMAQGTLSSFWIMVSEGIFPLTITPFAWLFKGVNFLAIFETGILFDEFILLLGCVLLASRYFKSTLTVVFVSAAITYTSVSSTQVWWNFHLLYLVPLMIYALDRAITESSAKYLFLFGTFGAATLLGNLPYFAPALAFAIFTFCAAIIFAAPLVARKLLIHFVRSFTWRHALALAVPAIFMGLIFLFYLEWQNQVVQFNLGRTQSGAGSDVGQFLAYASYADWGKYVELIGRYSNNIDNTIYGGLLVLPFALVAMLKVRKPVAFAFGATAIVLMSFTAATYVSVLFYYFFPLGNYFREIGILAPLAKVFLVFYAGFGFESYYATSLRRHPLWKRIETSDKIALLVPVLVIGTCLCLAVSTLTGVYVFFRFPPWAVPTSNQLVATSSEIVSSLLILSIYATIFLALMITVVFKPKWAAPVLLVLLTVSLTDGFSLSAQYEYSTVPQVSPAVTGLFNTYSYNFSMTRNQDYYANQRFATLAPFILGGPTGGEKLEGNGTVPYSTVGAWGALYWNMESFIYLNSVASPFRTDSLLKPVNEFYRVWVPMSQDVPRHIGFPIPTTRAYNESVGYNYPTLQLFSTINSLPNDGNISAILSSPKFAGGMIFANANDVPSVNKSWAESFRTSESVSFVDERVNPALLSVEYFSFDSLRLRIDTGLNSSSALYLADAWSPKWHATVNGVLTPVVRANLGFKAILLPPGVSEVFLEYGDTSDHMMLYAVMVLGLISFAAVILVAVENIIDKDARVRGSSAAL